MQLLSPRLIQRVEKLWWARRSVSLWHARRLHLTQPYHIVSSSQALSIQILSSMGALGRSYSSKVYFQKLHHVLRMCRSTSMNKSVLLWLTSPQEYRLVRLVVYLAGCRYAEYGDFLRHLLSSMIYDLNLGPRYGETKRRIRP